MTRLNLVFVCNGNSFRSQLAEGWGRALLADCYNIFSAGFEPHGVNPKAVALMAEAGVDISQQTSKHLDELTIRPDYIFTLCGDACPVFSAPCPIIKIDIPAPGKLAAAATTPEAADEAYRQVREQVRVFVENIEQYLNG